MTLRNINFYKLILRPQIFHCTKNHSLHQLAVTKKEEVKYPPITDVSNEGKRKTERILWYDSIKAMPTVDQKLHEISSKIHKTTRVYCFPSCAERYLGIPFQSYITRTHLIQGLPEQLLSTNVDEEFNVLSNSFCEVLVSYYYNLWAEDKSKKLSDYLTEENCGDGLVRSFLSLCFRKLAPTHNYLFESTIQQKPNIHSYWWHGGFAELPRAVDKRNLCFQFGDCPMYSIRTSKLLKPILPMDDEICATGDVPSYCYHPKISGIDYHRKKYLSCTPGYFSGDPFEFPLLQVYSADKLKLLSKIDHVDPAPVFDGFGIMSSFGWLASVAAYQGFTPFQNLTYPFVSYTIITNGQDWNFYAYQLNSVSFHGDIDTKDRRNLCWSSGKIRLFDSIEDGQIKGINDEVFKILLKLFLRVPTESCDFELKPYLGVELRSEEDILMMRAELRKMFRYELNLSLDFADDIPLWQRIYKFHKDAPPSPQIRME